MNCGHRLRTAVVAGVIACIVAFPTRAANAPPTEKDMDGDRFRTRSNAYTMESTDPKEAGRTDFCAPIYSAFSVIEQDGTKLTIRFHEVPTEPANPPAPDDREGQIMKAALEKCAPPVRVNTFTTYKIDKNALKEVDYRRTGPTVGTLLVPFKYRLGKAKELVSSPTVAPYAGWRTPWLQSHGITITPLIAAGIGLLPERDEATNTNKSTGVFSVAGGFIVGTDKNDAFNMGFVYGKDFAGKSETDTDTQASKPWVSIYIGFAYK